MNSDKEQNMNIEYRPMILNESVMKYLKDHYGISTDGYTDAQLRQAERSVLLDGLEILRFGTHW